MGCIITHSSILCEAVWMSVSRNLHIKLQRWNGYWTLSSWQSAAHHQTIQPMLKAQCRLRLLLFNVSNFELASGQIADVFTWPIYLLSSKGHWRGRNALNLSCHSKSVIHACRRHFEQNRTDTHIVGKFRTWSWILQQYLTKPKTNTIYNICLKIRAKFKSNRLC